MPTVFEGNAKNAIPRQTFDEAVMSAISKEGAFEAVGQSDIEAMLALEKKKDLLGCDDMTCLAEIGGALGAPLMIEFRVARVGDEWAVTSKGVDVVGARVVRRSTDLVQGEAGELLRAVPDLVDRLLRGSTRPDAGSASRPPAGTHQAAASAPGSVEQPAGAEESVPRKPVAPVAKTSAEP